MDKTVRMLTRLRGNLCDVLSVKNPEGDKGAGKAEANKTTHRSPSSRFTSRNRASVKHSARLQ